MKLIPSIHLSNPFSTYLFSTASLVIIITVYISQLLEEYVKEKKKNELLVEQEQELRNQLSLYTEKFEEFQKTLTRSV